VWDWRKWVRGVEVGWWERSARRDSGVWRRRRAEDGERGCCCVVGEEVQSVISRPFKRKDAISPMEIFEWSSARDQASSLVSSMFLQRDCSSSRVKRGFCFAFVLRARSFRVSEER